MKTLEQITTTYVDNLKCSIIRVIPEEKDSLESLGFEKDTKAIKYTRGDIPMVTIFRDDGRKFSWRINEDMPEHLKAKHRKQNEEILKAISEKSFYKA
jgi:hypothetical protein